MGVKAARAPFEHFGVGFVLRVGRARPGTPRSRGSADVLGRAAADSLDENRIDQAGMRVGDALDLDRVLPAVAEVVEIGEGLGAGVLDRPSAGSSCARRAAPTRASHSGSGMPQPTSPARNSQRCVFVQPSAAWSTRCSRSRRRSSGTSRRRRTFGLDIVEGDLEAGDRRRPGHAASVAGVFVPVPGEQLIEIADAVLVDAGQHVGQPGLRIDIVQARRLDQRVHEGGPLAAPVGAGKQPGLAPERDPAQRPFGRVVRQADAAVVEEAREGGPALEHVVHRLRHIGMAREARAFRAHPGLQIAHERRRPLLAHGEPLGRR